MRYVLSDYLAARGGCFDYQVRMGKSANEDFISCIGNTGDYCGPSAMAKAITKAALKHSQMATEWTNETATPWVIVNLSVPFRLGKSR